MEGVSFELALDLRRLRPLKARLMRLAVVFDPDEASVSLPPDELEESEELDEPSMSARTPGCDSSSMTCCGVLAYMYACDLSWNKRYNTYTTSKICEGECLGFVRQLLKYLQRWYLC